ncbi:MAG: preprotein translocase subunit SecG [Alphaproteobacteria bacterium]|nr:preprotein translocase subunit SecG [Alphaproteobacteria bacterium]
MQTIVLVVHLLLALALVGVVLLQKSEGGLGGLGGSGPGAGGGMGGLLGGRAASNLLTRATAILAGSFFITSISLAILAGGNSGPTSILQDGAGGGAPIHQQAPAPMQPHQPAVPTGE